MFLWLEALGPVEVIRFGSVRGKAKKLLDSQISKLAVDYEDRKVAGNYGFKTPILL